MNKAEALAVLHEIYMACPEFRGSNIERIDPNLAKISILQGGLYELRVKCNLDNDSRDIIKPILETHKLEMTETKDSITIYRPATKKP
jgi:hypothetical protein